MPENLLARETSPYLRQHKDNPVCWRPWGAEALAEAKRSNKPILLSVGYAACHWCHVMAHESFEDAETAHLMNQMFVNIKVDREERPDVDSLYQSALMLLGEQGGWPLTMFLTPDGQPFWGGTYFPPTPRFGRPAFNDVLRQVSHVFHNEPDKVQKNAAALTSALSKMAAPAAGHGLTEDLLNQAAAAALRLIDPFHGGTMGAPKFPQPVFLRLLWRAYKRNRAPLFRDAVTLTLDRICQGGIYDHLGGGFSRYSTDAVWLVPHFEKMLYDNALLVDLLTEVWQDTRSPLYAARIRETVGWVLDELRVDHPDGQTFAFASAFDADSDGEEGRYYLWTEEEIRLLLGPESALFNEVYDVHPEGNWEGRTILNRARGRRISSPDEEARLAQARSLLLRARKQRIAPARDDKVLADWNGLMISALARAAAVFDQPAWLDAARSALAFVSKHMVVDRRLLHVWCAGAARHPAIIEDYANLARAALSLYEVTADESYFSLAEEWITIANQHYWDGSAGGYYQSADDTADTFLRSKIITDNAVPSGNGTMVEVLARLYYLTGRDAYRERAEQLITLFSGDKPEYLIGVPGLLTNCELLRHAVQVVIVGPRADPARTELAREAFGSSTPLKIIVMKEPETLLPASHPAYGKTMRDGRPTAYVCVDFRCGPPLTDPAELRRQLASV